MRIQLQEWSEEQNVELSFDEIDALRRVAGKAISISPGSRRDAWNLKATSYVGAIRVGELAVTIQPKIPLENLFYMLSAGQSAIDFGTSLIGFEEHDLMPALAAFYERLLADTLSRGVLKSYKEHQETLVAMRGRIDIPAVIRAGGMPSPIPCRFDELSIDNPENRVLLTAALALTTYPEVAPRVRRDLRRASGVLDGVELVDSRALPAVHFTRLNRYYEPALRMAEVILRSGGIRDRVGSLEASTFLIDMNQLFERFVTHQLRTALAGKLEVRDQVQTHLDVGHKVPMRPDLVFLRRAVPTLVADIKYKLTDDGLGRNADYYQLLAYCSALQLQEGVLIYGADKVEQLETNVQSVSGEELNLVPLFVGGHLKALAESVQQLADRLHQRSRSQTVIPA